MLNITTRQINQLKKRKIGREEQLVRIIPNNYYDCRFENGLSEEFNGLNVLVIGLLKDISTKEINGKLLVVAKLQDRISHKYLNLTWFGNYDIYRNYRYHSGQMLVCYGKMVYDNNWNSFKMTNPYYFSDNISEVMQINADYGKKKNVAKETIPKAIKDSVNTSKEEYVPLEYLEKYKLPDINAMSKMLHFPNNPEEIKKALQRLYFDDMLEFAIGMKEKELPNGKPFINFTKSTLTHQIIKDLPYALTIDQEVVVTSLYNSIALNKKVNALIQGDVACGKTITAFLLAFMAVENGFQALIMAPTTVLATQHCNDLLEICEKHHKKVVFLKSKLNTKERKEILDSIKDGTADIIISTHAGVSENVVYNNLGLAVIDEEHKFGVETREKIREKSNYDLPFITMSATPIPRTLASTIYGDAMEIYTIKSMPDGRKPVSTICHTNNTIPRILTEELQKGHQAYIVCPLIEEASEESIMSECLSVEQVLLFYKKAYYNMANIRIEALTGKTSEEDTVRILKEFKENKIQILVSTTVIEVGVNNPNATVILLQNAERYGLSSMHQLRGRVRRGNFRPYCILVSKQGLENDRLKMMCQTDNGFEIAEADMKIRKTGNLLGIEQSGNSKVIDLIINYPQMYNIVKEIACIMINKKQTSKFISYMNNLRKAL